MLTGPFWWMLRGARGKGRLVVRVEGLPVQVGHDGLDSGSRGGAPSVQISVAGAGFPKH